MKSIFVIITIFCVRIVYTDTITLNPQKTSGSNQNPTSIQHASLLPGSCDFEKGTCNYTSSKDWRRKSGEMGYLPHKIYGDHSFNGKGYYALFQSSLFGSPSSDFISPQINLSTPVRMEFWYFSPTSGHTLDVFLKAEQSLHLKLLWSSTNVSTVVENWTQMTIGIGLQAHPFQVIFRGYKWNMVGIDDIKIIMNALKQTTITHNIQNTTITLTATTTTTTTTNTIIRPLTTTTTPTSRLTTTKASQKTTKLSVPSPTTQTITTSTITTTPKRTTTPTSTTTPTAIPTLTTTTRLIITTVPKTTIPTQTTTSTATTTRPITTKKPFTTPAKTSNTTTSPFKALAATIRTEPSTIFTTAFTTSYVIASTTSVMNQALSKVMEVENKLTVNCRGNKWSIRLQWGQLKELYPDLINDDIFLGDQSCVGNRSGDYLVFNWDYTECRSKRKDNRQAITYSNALIYAVHDPVFRFIIKEYRFEIQVNCVMSKDEEIDQSIHNYHIHNGNTGHSATASGHFAIQLSFFNDSRYQNELDKSSLAFMVGENIFIKAQTSSHDGAVKMRLSYCYTKPTKDASDTYIFYLIKNGCPANPNVNILSITDHETRFYFQDFDYYDHPDSMYLHCHATFCKTNEHTQTCHPVCH